MVSPLSVKEYSQPGVYFRFTTELWIQTFFSILSEFKPVAEGNSGTHGENWMGKVSNVQWSG